MAQSMSAEQRQACPPASAVDNTPDTGRIESVKGSQDGNEHTAARGSWPIMQIAGERLSNIRWQWKVFAPALGLDHDLAPPPVDVIQLQVGTSRERRPRRASSVMIAKSRRPQGCLVAPAEQRATPVCRQVTGQRDAFHPERPPACSSPVEFDLDLQESQQ